MFVGYGDTVTGHNKKIKNNYKCRDYELSLSP